MTNPVIPAEVLEVAVRATYEAAFGLGWELENDEFREDIRQSIRIALEAAAPYMMPKAELLRLADDMDSAISGGPESIGQNGRRFNASERIRRIVRQWGLDEFVSYDNEEHIRGERPNELF